jgi:GNAT superfamily N-acetyltransferase
MAQLSPSLAKHHQMLYCLAMVMLRHSSAGWEIRPHTRDDHPDIVRIFADCLFEFPRRDRAQEARSLHYVLRNSSILVATEENAGLIGFLAMQAEAAYVSHLFVSKDWRLCGVGSGLLEIGRGVAGSPLCLDVDLDNHAARAMYARTGWVETVNHGRPGENQTRLCQR